MVDRHHIVLGGNREGQQILFDAGMANRHGLITELGTGEALVSTLDAQGRPTMVDWCLLSPPRSHIGPIESTERERLFTNSPLQGLYDTPIDRESAYELLRERAIALQQARAAVPPEPNTMSRLLGGAGVNR